jgi:hypothetical protein
MAKTRGATGAAMTEAPRTGDPLNEQVVDELNATGQQATRNAAEEPATQPIVAQDEGGDPLQGTPFATELPRANDAGGSAEAISRRAYELYQARGGQHGADADDWFQAERELRSEKSGRSQQQAAPELGPSDEQENPAHRPID